MKIVIAPDSYKDALSARDAAAAIAEGLARGAPEAELIQCPMGDGGEGTLEALIAATGAERREARVQDALGRERQAAWGWLADSRSAFVELAEASGLQALTTDERTALHSTTFGVGQLILAALDAGAESLLLTLGGSATNDAGAGMLSALGARLRDAEGHELPPGGAALAQLERLDLSGLDPRLATLDVQAAVDVDNPLLGAQGASAIFGPQKGATPTDVEQLDRALGYFADRVAEACGEESRDLPGAGAAGGMGFAAKVLLGATLRPGIELVMEHAGFDGYLDGADWVITGEGQLDGQSLSGKTPIGVARRAAQHGVPTVVLAGRLGDGWQAAFEHDVTAAFALADGPMTLASALDRCADLLRDRSHALGRLWGRHQPADARPV
ncbi:glycerate kinase [Salinicola aestuarinus]|uniref:glycerate kinase n=1 Tax=Salinicola aestuarinus TaxID=1949082 RepID=UPI000DA12170|nr:glycerate kinase [Salinicola aestuarinus]